MLDSEFDVLFLNVLPSRSRKLVLLFASIKDGDCCGFFVMDSFLV